MTRDANEESAAEHEPIAIIGLSCRFPGGSDPESFWRLLEDGGDAIREVPPDRFDVDGFYDPRPATAGKIVTRYGGFLDEVDRFDAFFFGFSPREAVRMDPQQRLLLEVTWEAFEDGGLSLERLQGNRTGVFVGSCYRDYGDRQITRPWEIDIYANTGGSPSVLSGRISFAFGLEGPSVSLDAACATSLVAVHLACQSLRSGESELAVAAGANVILQPVFSIGFSQANMLAPDGRCKFCSADADGFVRSEGVGAVVLKRLSRALEDGDPIRALIRGSAVNNDGRSSGLLITPSRSGEEAVLRGAYRDAGLDPSTVDYVEAHGTGTAVGDPIEIAALASVVGDGRSAERPCRVGSVKSNVGHTEGASGIAGLIKVVLALEHGAIPPTLHCRELNPEIPWEQVPVAPQRDLAPWPAVAGRPRRAGVSAFGIAGTNAHVVVEEAPAPSGTEAPRSPTAPEGEIFLLPVSAHTPPALSSRIRDYRQRLLEIDERELHDFCFTAACRRSHHEHRLAVLGATVGELSDALAAAGDEPPRARASVARARRVFVFPGQGGQWPGMGRRLAEREPVFRSALERCDAEIRKLAGWSLLDELAADAAQSRLEEVDVVQPAIFAIQVALAALWRSWGIEPDAVVGQSLGEVAAAHVAGALSLADAARIICRRSRIVKRVSGQGAMAVVERSLEQASTLVEPYDGKVSVAVSSGPTSTVLSGDVDALREIVSKLESEEIFAQWVKVNYASHCAQMDPLREEVLQALEGITPRSAQVPFFSTVTCSFLEGSDLGPEYWMRNLRQPVLFAEALEQLVAGGHRIFIEQNAHPILVSVIRKAMLVSGEEVVAIASLRKDEDERRVLLESLGELYSLGMPVRWRSLYPEGRCLRLPRYPWQRERFWLELRDASVPSAGTSGHPLLGDRWQAAVPAGGVFFESRLGPGEQTFLADHRVQGAAVMPAAGWLEMVLAGGEYVFGSSACRVEEMVFERALFLPEEGTRRVQLALIPDWADVFSCQLFSREDQGGEDTSWELHAHGRLRRSTEGGEPGTAPEEIRSRLTEEVTAEDHYRRLHQRGLEYGSAFRGVERLYRREGEALAQVRLSEAVLGEEAAYRIHPALLDACFQTLVGLLPDGGGGSPFLPVEIAAAELLRPPPSRLWAHARLTEIQRPEPDGEPDRLLANVELLALDGSLVGRFEGLAAARLEAGQGSRTAAQIEDWLYGVEWREQSRPETSPGGGAGALEDGPDRWLIFADRGGVAKKFREVLGEQGGSSVEVTPGDDFERLSEGDYRLRPAHREDFEALFDEVVPDEIEHLIHFWSLDAPPTAETEVAALGEACHRSLMSVVRILQAWSALDVRRWPRVWIITSGAQPVGDAPASPVQAPAWGLGRTLAFEHPEVRTTLVDLGPEAGELELRSLLRELRVGDEEQQLALRGHQRFVARLAPRSPDVQTPESGITAGERPFRLEMGQTGLFETFELRINERSGPAPGHVEVEVEAAGMNFRDVLIALGAIPPLHEGSLEVGHECSGVISAVGEGVEDWQVGDEVLGLGTGSFGTHVTPPAELLVPKPYDMSFEEAATIPICFTTAYYALHRVGRLERGERILIHAAAGGVGLAAVQFARRAGCEIFATAGSPEKRDFLRSLGIRHVMDSRSLEFADQIRELTGGEGVDVVLNSIAGAAIEKGLDILRPYGRFLELGKVDIEGDSRLRMGLLRDSRSFLAVDLGHMYLFDPRTYGELLREVHALFEAGELEPLPRKTFPIDRAVEAFRYMARSRHIGKVVLSLAGRQKVPVQPAAGYAALRGDAAYLITGGLGGLGLAVARWMVASGARHLALIGRSDPSPEACEVLAELRAGGAEVLAVRADVGRPEDVERMLDEVGAALPPLVGVVHAAGVLADATVLQLEPRQFEAVMVPKVAGTWNLHQQTSAMALDFFVLFSSAASLVGSPGQGNYAAANAFLDALAHWRKAHGLPALSINWGAWADVGLAARPDRGGRLGFRGVDSMTPQQGVSAFARILPASDPQLAVVPFDLEKWFRFFPAARESPFFGELAERLPAGQQTAGSRSLSADELLRLEPEQRRDPLEDYLRRQIGQVLNLSPGKVAQIDRLQAVNRLGIDSLMAMEMKMRIEADLRVSIPVVHLIKGDNLATLADVILDQLGRGGEKPSAAPETVRLSEKVDELSEAEVESLLDEMIVEENRER